MNENLGKKSAEKDSAKAQAKVDTNKGKVKKPKTGEVIHLYEKSGLTERQTASLDALGKVVSDITHNKVYIFDTVEKTIDGQKVGVFAKDTAGFKAGTIAPNGFIDRSTGEVYIDLHAGTNGEGVILWTLAHELTHFVRQWSPAKFKVLADFLVSEYAKQGTDIRDLIHKKMAESKMKKLSFDEAYEEVIADSVQTMFTDTDLASKLEKLKNTDKNLWEKIKQFFADLYKRITEAYKNVSAQSEEAHKVMQMTKETIERISDLFAEGIVDAGNTYANADIKAVSGEADIDGNENSYTMSIRNTSKMSLEEQLRVFYKGELKSSDSLYFGNTPNSILSSGLNELPLAFTQKDFRKSTQKKHNIPRRALKSLNENLGNAMFSFGDGKKIGFIVPDVDGNGKPLLIAVEGDIQMDRQPVNAIKSMYGLDNPKEWLENQIKSGKQFVLYNEKRSNTFLQTYGYMATVGEGIKPSDKSISQPNEFVNASEKVSLSERNKNYETSQEVYDRLNKKLDGDVLYSDRKVAPGMTDFERYEILKGRSLSNIPSTDSIPDLVLKKVPEISSWEDINNYLGSKKKDIIRQLAKEFNMLGREYFNEDTDLHFAFSRNNFDETYDKQKQNYIEFAKMLSVLDRVIESAIGVEIHNRTYYKPDPTLDNMFVLMSAFEDGEFVVPVKLEVKKFKDKQNTLYVAVSLNKIKKTEVYGQGNTTNGVTQSPRSVNISISRIFSKINPSEKNFLKYLPDGFLNDTQRIAKLEALKGDADNAYKSAIKRKDMQAAQRMVDEAAKDAGYTIEAFHGTDADKFSVFDKGKIGDATGVSILGDGFYFAGKKSDASGYGKNVLSVYLKQENPYRATNDDVYRLNAAKLKAEGYDGVTLSTGDGYIYVVFDSEQVKSADPVTYDDNGNVVPLSERFNSANSDIRFSERKKKVDATVDKAIKNKGDLGVKYNQERISEFPADITAMVSAASEGRIDLTGKYIAINGNDVWHEYRSHSDASVELGRRQLPQTVDSIKESVMAIYAPDVVESLFTTTENPTQRQSFAYAKKSPNGYYIVVEVVGGKQNPNVVPVMMLQFTEAKWNDMLSSGMSLGELLFETDEKKRNALDVALNKKNRVTVAQFASKEAIANTPHSPQFNDSVSQNTDSVNTSEKFSLSERTDNSIDNRTLLANAFEAVAQNDVERSWLLKYKLQIVKLNKDQNKLAELRAEIDRIRYTKGQDRSKLPALSNKAAILADRINRADKQLLYLEASKPLKQVIYRERAKAYKLGMEKLAKYRKERAESKALQYYRPRIEKIVSGLQKRLEHPSSKTAIPEAFGASVAKVLSAFNFTTYVKRSDEGR